MKSCHPKDRDLFCIASQSRNKTKGLKCSAQKMEKKKKGNSSLPSTGIWKDVDLKKKTITNFYLPVKAELI